MIANLLFIGASASGAGMIWRALITDNEGLRAFVKKYAPGIVFEALTCSFCLNFWISLAAALLFDPFSGFLPPLRFALPHFLLPALQVMMTWMAIGVFSLGIRIITEQLYRIANVLACILKNHPMHKH
jgi:hypothetical protein